MHVVSTFVRIHGFQVRHVPHRRILDQNPIPSQETSRLAGGLTSHIDSRPFGEGDLLRRHVTSVLQTAELKADELALGDSREHFGEADLLDLFPCDGAGEHDALFRVA